MDIANAYEQEQPYRHVPHPPILLSFSAIPGSGKTYLAKRLMHDLHAQYMNHDDIREIIRIRGIDPEGLFMPPISKIVIDHMVQHDQNKFVILDVSLDRRWDIYFNSIKEYGATPIIIRLNPPLDVIRERLRLRDGDNSALLQQLDRFKSEFDNCSQHVEADITVGETYDYEHVLQVVRDKVAAGAYG